MLETTLCELREQGVTEVPEVLLADAHYWHSAQMQAITDRGFEVLVPPDGNLREGKRPGWENGLYELMRSKLTSERGRTLYAQRKITVEPVYGQIKYNRRVDRFMRRGSAAQSEWRDLDLRAGLLTVTTSKTAAGRRQVVLEPELAQLLREHKLASKWSQAEDLVFPGRFRNQPRERNSLRTRVLHGAIERANEQLTREDRPLIPASLTFHGLRRTYAALCAELGEHPAITAAQMGHRDPRMTLRVYYRRHRRPPADPPRRPAGRRGLGTIGHQGRFGRLRRHETSKGPD